MAQKKGISMALTIVITVVVLIVVAMAVIMIVTGGLGKFGAATQKPTEVSGCQTCVQSIKASQCITETTFDASTVCADACKGVTGVDTSGDC